MKYCPECKSEYRDEYDICSDCGAVLKPEEKKMEETDCKMDVMKPHKIYSAADSIQAGIVKELLYQNVIESLSKSAGDGDFLNAYMGFSVYGSDIYVDEKDAQKALELLTLFEEENTEFMDKEEPGMENGMENLPWYRNRVWIARLIAACMVLPCLIALIMSFLP